jgi:predicted transcriptional regulator
VIVDGQRRAEPPITRTVILDENTRRVPSFAFFNTREW